MKNNFRTREFTRFHRQRIHDKDSDNMPELIKPQLERTEIELENLLRWEDDGGKIIETVKAIS